MRNMAVLHSPAFSYPLPVLVRVLFNLLIFKGKILYYNKYNYILSKDLPVECGINRALIRSLTTPGAVRITAKADGLQSAEISLSSAPVEVKNGLSNYIPGDELEGRLTRGETPLTPSYKDTKVDVNILSAVAGANQDEAIKSFDDNELSEWKNDGRLNSAWV